MARMVEFPGPKGRVRGYVAKPEKPAPGVLILHPGKLEDLEAFSERISAEGFVALVPDLTYGQPPVRDASSLDGQTAVDVAASAAGLLLGQSGLEGNRIGIMAFGSAVPVATTLAGLTPQTIGAMVVFSETAEAADLEHLEIPAQAQQAAVDPTRRETLEDDPADKALRGALDFFREHLTAS
ncbi:MAG: dienelactone hydrolase family protein [Actinomycetota bacterium]